MFYKVDHIRVSRNFTGIDLFSIIYVRYCRSEFGKGTVKLVVK